MTEWEIMFEVLGMTTSGVDFPKIVRIDEDMLLRGIESRPSICMAHFRIVRTREEEQTGLLINSEGYKEAQERLLSLASLFALQTGVTISFEGCGGKSLKDSKDFGKAKGLKIKAEVSIPPEKLKEYRERQHKHVRDFALLFKEVEARLKKAYLKNALHYLYYGIESDRFEEKIINFFIAVEALLGEAQEVTYKIAVRSAVLLDCRIPNQKTLDIFEDMKLLYRARCDIVHGRRTRASYSDAYRLQTYLEELIRIFIRLPDSMRREDILKLVNDSMFDIDSHIKLVQSIGIEMSSAIGTE